LRSPAISTRATGKRSTERAGVEAIAYRCAVSCEQIAVTNRVPLVEQADPPHDIA